MEARVEEQAEAQVRRRFTVEEFHRMAEAGILHEDDRVELIEVSDTTLAYDPGIKLPQYARFGIREAWIVVLNTGVAERHTEPSPNGYRLVRRAGRGETLTSEALPEIVLPVDAILG